MPFEMDNGIEDIVRIKVIGVGGGGGNAINRMVRSGIKGVEFVSVNTDRQALNNSQATHKIQIGEKVTGGQGAGANPTVGQHAAEESRDAIADGIGKSGMVFITAGMGGGTGTGAAPIVAQIAKDEGILTVGIVTTPFAFEGKHRMEQAQAGIAELSQHVDSLIVIPNERLKLISKEKITLANAFEVADSVLNQGVRNIAELIKCPGLVNVDFADIKSVMTNAGRAHMGVGIATGKNKAEEAARLAVSSPLLETTIEGAKGVVISMRACSDIELDEVENAAKIISDAADANANIIWGVQLDSALEDQIEITVIATGFGSPIAQQESRDISSGAKKEPERKAYSPFDLRADMSDNGKGYGDDDDDDFSSISKLFGR